MRKLEERETVDMTSMIDMTSMVDVTFLLLAFFMVTATFVVQQSLPLPTAQDGLGPQAEREPMVAAEIVVEIDEYNTYSVITDEDEVEAPSVQELLQHVRHAVMQQNATQLLVRASRNATHQRVVAALDVANKTGVDEIRLETIDDA